MTDDQKHPAERYDDQVAALASRAKLAVVALAGTTVVRLWDLGVRQWSIHLLDRYMSSDEATAEAVRVELEKADGLVNAGLMGHYVALVVTAVLFLRWLHLLVSLTSAFGDGYLAWKPSTAVWSFFVPIVSLFRPYQVLRDVQAALDPSEILPPAPRVDRDAAGDYRSVTLIEPPMPNPLPKAFLGAWWGMYIGSNVLSKIVNSVGKNPSGADAIVAAYRGDIVVDALEIVAAILAIRVVQSVSARLAERFRRIRYTTPESLEAQGVSIR